MRHYLICLALLGPLLATPAGAALVEETLEVPVHVRDLRGSQVAQSITVTLWRDDEARSPQPVAVLQHGRPTHPLDRQRMGRVRYASQAQWLVRQGFMVVVPTRVGYGPSGGPDVEASGSCSFKNYAPGFEAAALQTLAVLAAVRERPEADKSRGVVMGQSFGGAAAIALAAMNPPGVQAIVNFSGGAGGDPVSRPEEPCSPSAMKRLFARYGAQAQVPTLWVYGQNDAFFGSRHPREWLQAYRDAGGEGELAWLPALPGEGHALFAKGASLWLAPVKAFLQAHDGQRALQLARR